MRLPKSKEEPIHIVGISSVEGAELFRYFWNRGHRQFVLHDLGEREGFVERFVRAHVALGRKRAEQRAKEILSRPVGFCFGSSYLKGIEWARWIGLGQNWDNYEVNFPRIPQALQRGAQPIYLMELYFHEATCPIVGVTGTNGKTTTCHLLKHLISQERHVLLAGNDIFHPQCLEEVRTLGERDVLILEISNRHLKRLNCAPFLAVLTSLGEDHLDEHGSWENYLLTKSRIFALQRKGDLAVLPERWRWEEPFRSSLNGLVTTFGLARGDYLLYKGWLARREGAVVRRLLPRQDFPLPGLHNVENALAAMAAAELLGISLPAIQKGLRSFSGVKNRCQKVQTLQGVEFYNDLASTSPAATLAALSALATPMGRLFWIGGGEQKGADYTPLVERAREADVQPILLPGSVCELLREKLPSAVTVGSLKEALFWAWEHAKAGDRVVLSPGGAGVYSQFLCREGGFNRMVKKLKRWKRCA